MLCSRFQFQLLDVFRNYQNQLTDSIAQKPENQKVAKTMIKVVVAEYAWRELLIDSAQGTK
ncbi:MAG: hypothetical protein ACI837_003257 [Crocinitomicaceae bacterium]|jgi:hypothetical protein